MSDPIPFTITGPGMYRLRDRKIVELGRNCGAGATSWPWTDGERIWSNNGAALAFGRDDWDVVARVEDEAKPEAPAPVPPLCTLARHAASPASREKPRPRRNERKNGMKYPLRVEVIRDGYGDHVGAEDARGDTVFKMWGSDAVAERQCERIVKTLNAAWEKAHGRKGKI